MPLKRTPRTMRETPAARALRAAVAEEMEAMMARIPPGPKGSAKKAARAAARTLGKGRSKWDRETPSWRSKQAAKILAELRRYDKSATLPPDGGRDLYAIRKLHVAPAPAPVDYYVQHHAAHSATEAAAPAKLSPDAEKAVPADELAERRKKRRGPRAGHAGFIDPRLFDSDDWD